MRRIGIVLGGALVFASLGVSPALADTGGSCVDDWGAHYWAYETNDPNPDVNSITASIRVASGYFYNCGAPYFGNDGVSAWVSLVPGPGNSHWGDGDAIIQLGVVNCNQLGSVCNNTLHYTWATGGCSGFSPIFGDLGGATYGAHSYLLYLNTSTLTFEYYIDGVKKKTTGLYDTTIKCWAPQETIAEGAVERWDAGDSAGGNDTTSHRAQLNWLQWQGSGGSWHNFSNDGCINTRPSGTGRYSCVSGSGNGTYGSYLHVWTTY